MARRKYVRRPITISRAPEAKKPDPTKVLNFIGAIVDTQIGTDENPSPMLQSMIDDLGADADDVELAQDIALLGREIQDAIADAIIKGEPGSLVFTLMGIIGPAIPEIEKDIKALKS